jgi:hypothetical protein
MLLFIASIGPPFESSVLCKFKRPPKYRRPFKFTPPRGLEPRTWWLHDTPELLPGVDYLITVGLLPIGRYVTVAGI